MNDTNKTFTLLAEEIFNKYLEINPQHGADLGLHQYDGRIGNYTSSGMEDDLKTIKELLAKLSEIKFDELNSENKFDFEIAKWGLESFLFDAEVIRQHKFNPMTYAFMFGGLHNYISRNYAPFDDRLKSVISIIEQIPAVLEEAETILNKRLPAVLCRYAKQFSLGYEEFFTDELLSEIKDKSSNENLIKEYTDKSGKAVEAFKKFVVFIDNASSEDNKDFITGKEIFGQMLKVKEHIGSSVEEIRKTGLDELERLNDKMKSVLKENNFEGKIETLEHTHPSETNLIAETNSTLNELIDFIRKNDIVDLPERLNCIVTEMPRYMNFGFAAMGTAGPFEKSDESFYYVNLPDKEWSEEKREEWMTQFNYPSLKLISAHEAYPGHYTHFLNSNLHASKLAKIFMSYSYVEGWAHYTEEMMVDEGYSKEDFKIKIGQIIEALIRCCRYLASIMLHCDNKSIEEIKDFFVKNAYMTETTAMQEAERGAFDPGYLNYTLGKIYLKKFKKKYFDKHGNNKSLKDFHNLIVSLGAPTYDIAERYSL
jgi:uncharacterized protein (DUF885 family)